MGMLGSDHLTPCLGASSPGVEPPLTPQELNLWVPMPVPFPSC